MAGETILVVDDAPVTLKLVASLLRGEGYRVQLASNAEQAASSLRTLRPDLVIIDIHLPGMDGFELGRQITQDPRLQGVVLVAMSASSGAGLEQEARDAGFRGFIAKPIEAHTLRTLVLQFLRNEPAVIADQQEPTSTLSSLSLSGPAMETLRRGFLEDGLLESRQLAASLDTHLDVAAAKRTLYHWIGAAGLLGYHTIATAARQIEPLLNSLPANLIRVRELFHSLVNGFSQAVEAAHTALPASLIAELEGKRIALVGFSDAQAERVCAALKRVAARPRLLAPETPPDSSAVAACDALMVHVRPETMSVPALAPPFDRNPALPVILVGAREHILLLDPSVPSKVSEFLIDGWQPEELLMRLKFALAAGASQPAVPAPAAFPDSTSEPPTRNGSPRRVLIADDDGTIRLLVRTVLENEGMECLLVSNGEDALQAIREHHPQAAILDVNMPGMSGFELLTAIREDALPIRVILLTARQQEDDVARGFILGADDYLIKPFSPVELLLRLKRLL